VCSHFKKSYIKDMHVRRSLQEKQERNKKARIKLKLDIFSFGLSIFVLSSFVLSLLCVAVYFGF
jgi:hypothetical protein